MWLRNNNFLITLDSELSFTYNVNVKRDARPDILQTRIQKISHFYNQKSRMPSFSEIGEIVGFRSKNAVFKLINKLETLNVLGRDTKGKLIPRSIASSVLDSQVLPKKNWQTPCPLMNSSFKILRLPFCSRYLEIQCPGQAYFQEIWS